jgi:hypothetical protein
MESPITDLRRKKNKLGKSKQGKMMGRIMEMKGLKQPGLGCG